MSVSRGVGLPRWYGGKESTCQCRRCRTCGFDTWVRKITWRRNGNPLQYSCLENPMNRGAWKTTVHGISKSWTWLSNWAPMCIRGRGPWTRLVLARWKVEVSLLICEWISGNLVSWLQERAESGAVLMDLFCTLGHLCLCSCLHVSVSCASHRKLPGIASVMDELCPASKSCIGS